MNLDYKLILDELHKLFDKSEAHWDRRFAEMDAAWDRRVMSRGGSVPTPAAAMGADVVADNWGGLFDGGDTADGTDLPAATFVTPATAPASAIYSPDLVVHAEQERRAAIVHAKQERRAAVVRVEHLVANTPLISAWAPSMERIHLDPDIFEPTIPALDYSVLDLAINSGVAAAAALEVDVVASDITIAAPATCSTDCLGVDIGVLAWASSLYPAAPTSSAAISEVGHPSAAVRRLHRPYHRAHLCPRRQGSEAPRPRLRPGRARLRWQHRRSAVPRPRAPRWRRARRIISMAIDTTAPPVNIECMTHLFYEFTQAPQKNQITQQEAELRAIAVSAHILTNNSHIMVTPMALKADAAPVSVDARWVFEEIPSRYSIIVQHVPFMSPILLFGAISIHEAPKLLETIATPSLAMLWPTHTNSGITSLANMDDGLPLQIWSPLFVLVCSAYCCLCKVLVNTHDVCKVFEEMLTQNPVQLMTLGVRVQCRPIPWPSFSSFTAPVHLKISQSDVSPWVSLGCTYIVDGSLIQSSILGIITSGTYPSGEVFLDTSVSMMISSPVQFKLSHKRLFEGLVQWLSCNSQYTVAGPFFPLLSKVRSDELLLVYFSWKEDYFLRWSHIHIHDVILQLSPPAVDNILSALWPIAPVNSKNFFSTHDASVLHNITGSVWLHMSKKAIPSLSCEGDSLGMFEWNIIHTISGIFLRHTSHSGFRQQWWQLSWQPLVRRYFNWEIFEWVLNLIFSKQRRRSSVKIFLWLIPMHEIVQDHYQLQIHYRCTLLENSIIGTVHSSWNLSLDTPCYHLLRWILCYGNFWAMDNSFTKNCSLRAFPTLIYTISSSTNSITEAGLSSPINTFVLPKILMHSSAVDGDFVAALYGMDLVQFHLHAMRSVHGSTRQVSRVLYMNQGLQVTKIFQITSEDSDLPWDPGIMIRSQVLLYQLFTVLQKCGDGLFTASPCEMVDTWTILIINSLLNAPSDWCSMFIVVIMILDHQQWLVLVHSITEAIQINDGPFSGQITFLRRLCRGINLEHKNSSFLWDPGGSKFLQRLGGKPKLKKGGMLGTSCSWAVLWAAGLAQSSLHLVVAYKSTSGRSEKGIKHTREMLLTGSWGTA